MYRLLSIAAVLCIAVATPLVAQQTSNPAAPASSGRTTQAGPRLQPEWRSLQPAFADSSASSAAVSSNTHTITVTTLVLVLVVIILVLLIAR